MHARQDSAGVRHRFLRDHIEKPAQPGKRGGLESQSGRFEDLKDFPW
jgi:hypothetical protein